MNKQYHYKLCASLIIIPSVFIYLFILIYSYLTHDVLWFVISLIGLPIICWGALLNLYTTATLTDNYIHIYSKKFMPPRKLNWSEIELVVDDVLEFLTWCPYMHRFNLIPKRKFGEPLKKWVILTAYFKNYKDLLREVVLRVSPDTKVESSILKLTGLTQQDIGRYNSPTH